MSQNPPWVFTYFPSWYKFIISGRLLPSSSLLYLELDLVPMPRNPDTSALTSEQVATILGVTKRTLKNWLRSGKIPEPRRNPRNNYRLWTLTDVEVIRHILREES